MRRHALASASLAMIAFAMPAMANEDVRQQSAKPEQWVLPNTSLQVDDIRPTG